MPAASFSFWLALLDSILRYMENLHPRTVFWDSAAATAMKMQERLGKN